MASVEHARAPLWTVTPTRALSSASRSAPPAARRLSGMLLASFVGTIVLFLISAGVANYREQGITRAAESISDVGLPSIQHLSAARTALRNIELLLYQPAGSEERGARIAFLRKQLLQEWSAYKVLPAYRGEPELQAVADDALRDANQSLDEVLSRLGSIGPQGSVETVRDTRAMPALERLDIELHALLELDAVRAAEQGRIISDLRRTATIIGLSLHGLAALLAALSGLLLYRLIRRFIHVTDVRVSELEQFAGRVAHDIRSPLHSVGMSLELAKSDLHLAEKTRNRLERSGRTVQRIGQLVDGLLVFAASGAPPAEDARADVRDVVDGVIDGITPRAQEKDIELKAESVEPGSVACSPGVLMSIFANLVGNAIKYMNDSPVRRILVRARDAGSTMRIEVEDSGPGISPEVRPHIFEPYVRGDRASNVAGLGLGLATVRRLVEAHGGCIGVEPNPGGGSVFWFQLPKASRTGADLRARAGDGRL